MDEVIQFPQYEELKKEVEKLHGDLSNLILERDELLYHECKAIETEYMMKIGTLECKAYEFQCSVLKIKRKMQLIQMKINLQENIDLHLIEVQLDEEYAEHMKLLEEKKASINEALHLFGCDMLSPEDTKELKALYRKIVKKLHPDINPNASENEKIMFLNAAAAYENGDLHAMRTIDLAISDISQQSEAADPIDSLYEQRNLLRTHISEIRETIGKIKNSFPYNEKDFLENEKEVSKRAKELEKIIDDYKELYREYEQKLKELMR